MKSLLKILLSLPIISTIGSTVSCGEISVPSISNAQTNSPFLGNPSDEGTPFLSPTTTPDNGGDIIERYVKNGRIDLRALDYDFMPVVWIPSTVPGLTVRIGVTTYGEIYHYFRDQVFKAVLNYVEFYYVHDLNLNDVIKKDTDDFNPQYNDSEQIEYVLVDKSDPSNIEYGGFQFMSCLV